MSCKYYYRGGLCANSQMDKPFCVGEDKCDFLKGKMAAPPASAEASVKAPVKQDVEITNVVMPQGRQDDGLSQWMGVYCPHYQRFYCTGGADGCKTGCCATAEDYEKALSAHMEKQK